MRAVVAFALIFLGVLAGGLAIAALLVVADWLSDDWNDTSP